MDDGYRFMREFAIRKIGHTPRCLCHACIKSKNLRDANGFLLSDVIMVLCPDCGDKRCPKAADHRNACKEGR